MPRIETEISSEAYAVKEVSARGHGGGQDRHVAPFERLIQSHYATFTPTSLFQRRADGKLLTDALGLPLLYFINVV
jgi:hypothetical protein